MCEAVEVDRLFAPETQHDIFSLPLLLTSILPPLSHCTSPSGRQYAILSRDSLALNLCFSLFEFSGLEDRRRTNPSRYREFTGLVSDRETSHLPCIRIRTLLSQLSLPVVLSSHLRLIASQAAIVCQCYIWFKHVPPTPTAWSSSTELESWIEFGAAGTNISSLVEDLGGCASDQPFGLFSEILHRLGPWGLATKLGDILNVASHEPTCLAANDGEWIYIRDVVEGIQ